MYGPPWAARPRGGGAAAQPLSPPPYRPPNFAPFAPTPTPSNHHHQVHQPRQSPGSSKSRGGGSRQSPRPVAPSIPQERVEAAVAKAKQDLLLAGESVSSLKVAQSAAVTLQVDFGTSMWYQLQEAPLLKDLMLIEGKVSAFIHCFVSARRFTSVHELNVELCKNEGIEQFEELGLGPLLRHPLVVHYFSIPSDATEVVKITSEDIIGRLDTYLYRCKKKEVVVEEFLDFLGKKHLIDDREKLGVRIRNLGLHIKYIKDARRTEFDSLEKARQVRRKNIDNQREEEELPQATTVTLQSEGAESFIDTIPISSGPPPSPCEDMDSDEDDEDNYLSSQYQNLSQSLKDNSFSSSIIEEVKLLNRKPGIVISEEKYKNEIRAISEVMKFKTKRAMDFLKGVGNFITLWKKACQEHSAPHVLSMMANYYFSSSAKKRRKMSGLLPLFSSKPASNLLKVFITFAKLGLLDIFCNALNLADVVEHGSVNSSSAHCSKTLADGPSLSLVPISENNEGSYESRQCVAIDDIVKKIASYFELDPIQAREREWSLEKQISLFKKFCDCERWLAKEFSVEEFNYLGYGNFFEFLEKNASLLPPGIHKYFIGDLGQNSTSEISMIQDQLKVFLSQAENSMLNNDPLDGSYVSFLLKRQFPTISFQIMGNEVDKHFSDLIKRQKESGNFSCVSFSATLLGKESSTNSFPCSDNHSSKVCGKVTEVIHQYDDSFGAYSSRDAIECLLKAPMLSDLQSWSHWDLTFAPSLGPLLEWLLTEVHIKELSCIVTRDGKLIRIDHSTTVDEFLDASIHGSSFQAAVKLLSLLSLYGGTSNFPLSLIKCHAQRAIDVMIRNSTDHMALNKRKNDPMLSSSCQDQEINEDFYINPISDVDSSLTTIQSTEVKDSHFEAVNTASKFILDCLGYLPSEFRSFGAEILVLCLQSFTKDAPLVILRKCSCAEERHMLHDIGLSLGIVEWIDDYHAFSSETTVDMPWSSNTSSNFSEKLLPSNSEVLPSVNANSNIIDLCHKPYEESKNQVLNEESNEKSNLVAFKDKPVPVSQDKAEQDAIHIIECIRREEFGLDSNLEYNESSCLVKQHARLGRALHCLSQELYSQDSHLLLELVQNADDNTYPENVEATLVFILQPMGIILLNNEEGFSANNIRALCDIGNSTKKGSNAGYIGKKGIGFKSVFRVTEAPEIHSNGFHVKFDTRDGPIGFVLPTVIPSCNMDSYQKLLSSEDGQENDKFWKTCIVLPFRSNLREGVDNSSVTSMFSDLHPSLLLFLHRIQCIKYKNMLTNTLVVMRKETLENGIIKVSNGSEKMSWLVVRQKLHASMFRSDIQNTEVAVAFTLLESENGGYKPCIFQQPVFAFLPLRMYGLKFILQGDFVLPSSREEVDGNSAWNQWLLSEFPSLFVSAERSFCALPCFKENPGEAVTAFMSFVPLAGEVFGFFSRLPHMIISKLRISDCLVLEGDSVEWVPPYKVLRGWDKEVLSLVPDNLLKQHLGLGYLSKDIILSDALAKALGVNEYGPKVLIDIMMSICHDKDGIKLLSLDWISSWLMAFGNALSAHSARHHSLSGGLEFDLFNTLRKLPCIPLSDGSYSSLDEGSIWLPCDFFGTGFEGRHGPKDFPLLYSKLRIVSPSLFSAVPLHSDIMEETRVANIMQLLHKIGIQHLSAHEVIKTHILPAFSENKHINEGRNLTAEYLSFVMLHFQYSCPSCRTEKAGILVELKKKAVILTNHGYKCPIEEPIHFSKEFGNSVNIKNLIDQEDTIWHEVDVIYLKHPSAQEYSSGDKKWREFFLELGVTDFVQVVSVEKNISDIVCMVSESTIPEGKPDTSGLLVSDWESPELAYLLSRASSQAHRKRCKYLMELLDKMWDDYFSTKAHILHPGDNTRPIRSSFLKSIQNVRWVASRVDKELHYPKDVFYDCEAVRSILGTCAVYAIPKVSSKKFLEDIGFKTHVSFDDALKALHSWRMSDGPFKASIAQMTRFYEVICDGVIKSEGEITDELRSSPLIFIPSSTSSFTDAVPGIFVTPGDVYWHDPTGCIDHTKEIILRVSTMGAPRIPCRTLSTVYPSLHDFFVNECGVLEKPKFGSYFQTLLQLSTSTSPSEAAHAVFLVFLKWANDLKTGTVKEEEIFDLKESLSKLENAVLPTIQDRWVSLHPSFGLICWSDDEELGQQFKKADDVQFLQFGELNSEEKEMLPSKIASLLRKIGVPALSEVLTREAIFYGSGDNLEKASLINWVLPYLQRYLLKFHPDIYHQMKQVWSNELSQLQVVVVEKLFYKYTLKGHDSISNKRFDCSCLLQGNIMYTSQASDPHGVFMELSRIFFGGSVELHLANFLQLIITKAESGCTEEQIELFTVNNQKVPKISDGEPEWSLASLSWFDGSMALEQACYVPMANKQIFFTYPKKLSTSSHWPPTNPHNTVSDHHISLKDPSRIIEGPVTKDATHTGETPVSVIKDGDGMTAEDFLVKTMASLLPNADVLEETYELAEPSKTVESKTNPALSSEVGLDDSSMTSSPDGSSDHSAPFEEMGKHLQASNEIQSYKTGRRGESFAHKYFSEKLSAVTVKWVNEETETGLPYDLIIGDKEESREYVEVKATTSSSKDWFPITTREWQFAVEKGDSFSIAHVVLEGSKRAKITIMKNPLKLCQQGMLQLFALMSQQIRKSSSTT